MKDPKQRLHTKKYRWMLSIRKIEDSTRKMLQLVKANGREARVSTIVSIGNRILRAGMRGEALWDEILETGKTLKPLEDVSDQLGYLEQLSEALDNASSKLLGMRIRSFRRYFNTKVYPNAKVESEVLRDLDDLDASEAS